MKPEDGGTQATEVRGGTAEPELQVSEALQQNLLLEAELRHVVELLHQAGITPVVLKGTPLLRLVYGSLTARRVSDMDLLVRPADVRMAVTALSTRGYQLSSFCDLEATLAEQWECSLSRAQAGATLHIDLHWHAFSPLLYDVPLDAVWKAVMPCPLPGAEYHVLNQQMTLLHLAAHYHQHAFCAPRILRDLAAAWTAFDGSAFREELTDRAQTLGLAHVWDFAARTAERLGYAQGLPLCGSRRAQQLSERLPLSWLASNRPRAPYAVDLASLTLISPHKLPGWSRRALLPSKAQLAQIYRQPASYKLYWRVPVRLTHPLLRLFGWKAPWES